MQCVALQHVEQSASAGMAPARRETLWPVGILLVVLTAGLPPTILCKSGGDPVMTFEI